MTKTLLIPLIWLILACGSKDKPNDLLSDSEMVNLLTAMHLADAKNGMPENLDDTLSLGLLHHYRGIFQEHDIQAERFRQSYNYYITKPAELKAIYDSILSKLELKDQRKLYPSATENKKNTEPSRIHILRNDTTKSELRNELLK